MLLLYHNVIIILTIMSEFGENSVTFRRQSRSWHSTYNVNQRDHDENIDFDQNFDFYRGRTFQQFCDEDLDFDENFHFDENSDFDQNSDFYKILPDKSGK